MTTSGTSGISAAKRPEFTIVDAATGRNIPRSIQAGWRLCFPRRAESPVSATGLDLVALGDGANGPTLTFSVGGVAYVCSGDACTRQPAVAPSDGVVSTRRHARSVYTRRQSLDSRPARVNRKGADQRQEESRLRLRGGARRLGHRSRESMLRSDTSRRRSACRGHPTRKRCW